MDIDGNHIRSIGTTQDITVSVEAENAAREGDQRFISLLNEQADMMSVFLPDGKRKFVNKAFSKFVGRPQKSLIAGQYGDYPAVQKHAPSLCKVIKDLTPASPRKEQTFQMKRHDGEFRKVHWSDCGLFDDDGNLIEILTIGHDITDQI